MNFNKSEHCVNKKGKEVLMRKVTYEKTFNGLQDLEIDKLIMYGERSTKMSQHNSQKFILSHEDWLLQGRLMPRLEVLPILNYLHLFKRRS